MPTVSHSEVDNYRRCPKRWEYRYKIGLKRIRKGIRLLRGEILHEMLNAYIKAKMYKGYIGKDPWSILDEYADLYSAYFEEEREHYGDIIGDCGEIFEGYLRKYRKDPLKYEASEQECYFDISDKLRFAGFIDKIATDQQGRRWIVDHKFVQNIPTADDRFSELQLLLYVWAMSKKSPDLAIDGVLWDYARSKAPTKPEVLKKGGLSQRKNLDCDPHTYLLTIAENNLNPADYIDMLAHLEGKEETFYERVFLPKPSAHMIKEVTEDFLQSAREIQVKRGKGKEARCVRTMNQFNCSGCEFRPVCEADVRGLDAEFIIKSEYKQREIGDK
jgi:RecB family exonuclease